MRLSTLLQYLGVMTVFASIFLPSLDMTRLGMLIGLVVFWVGVGMERNKKDDNG